MRGNPFAIIGVFMAVIMAVAFIEENIGDHPIAIGIVLIYAIFRFGRYMLED